jgi:hypothetical protein
MQSTLPAVTVPATYTDPELESSYAFFEQEQMTKAEINGKHDGKNHQPSDARRYKVQTISSLRSAVQSLIDVNHLKHQFLCDVGYAQTIRKDTEKVLNVLRNESKATELKLANVKNEEQQLKCDGDYGWSTKMQRGILLAFALVEGALTYLVLKNISSSFVLNILLSLTIMFVAGTGLNVGANHIATAATPYNRRVRYAVVLSVGLLFSIVIGYSRGNLNNQALAMETLIAMDTPAPRSNALPFMLISFVAFWVALALELKHWRSPADKAKIKAYKDKQREVAQYEKEVQKIQVDIAEANRQLTMKTDLVLRRQIYARDFEMRLISLAQKLVDTYESANVEFRHECPKFFGEKVDFEFSLHYQDLLKTSKQPV